MIDSSSTLIYLDTNAYSRPFDDQTQADIQAEVNAFLDIIAEVKTGKLLLLGSDILDFEVHNVLKVEKRTKIKDYLSLCHQHVENSEDALNLGKQIQADCHIRTRDALHIASAIIGQAR